MNEIDKELSRILEVMKSLQDTDDQEVQHIDADDQLKMLVELLGEQLGRSKEVKQITEEYDKINKWYA